MALLWFTISGGFDPHDDFPGIGELDGVSDKVDQDLAQAVRITCDKGRGFPVYPRNQSQAFAVCLKRQHGNGFLDERA